MTECEIIDNGIILKSTPAAVRLYRTSINVIQSNTEAIDVALENHRLFSRLTEELKKTKINASIPDYETYKMFIDTYCAFLNMIEELIIVSRELSLAKYQTEHIFYIKAIYISLFRYIERIDKKCEFLCNLAQKHDLETQFGTYIASFRIFKNKYYSEIKDNRNKLSAHFKDMAYIEYDRQVKEYDGELVAQMSNEFLASQEYFVTFMKELMKKIMLEVTIFIECLQKEHWISVEKLKGTIYYKAAKQEYDSMVGS